jgi:hypothetical protein
LQAIQETKIKTSRGFGLKRFVGAPDIKRPVRRSLWLRRLFFVGLFLKSPSSARIVFLMRSSNSGLKFYNSGKQEREKQ